jgi:hypothetical protein
MQKWEYKVMQMVFDDDLDRAGEEGWELVSVIATKEEADGTQEVADSITAYLKRPLA